jgi:chromosome partitioning protein
VYTIAIANFKGGTGKTATSHALGVALATGHGRRVLLVDCDAQGSLTSACGAHDVSQNSLARVFDESFPSASALQRFMYGIIRQVQPGLDLAPADIGLARSEQRLLARLDRDLVLRSALSTVASKYDVALLDCPPNLGLLTTNALAAANAVLIPTIPNILDLRALKLFLDALQDFRKWLNPNLEILGILITFLDLRTTHHQRIVEAMQGLSLPVLSVTIGRSIRVAEASNESKSIVDYEPWHTQAEAYRQLATHVDNWISARTQQAS